MHNHTQYGPARLGLILVSLAALFSGCAPTQPAVAVTPNATYDADGDRQYQQGETPPKEPENILALAAIDTLVFCGTKSGDLYRSKNKGIYWGEPKANFKRIYALANTGKIVFAGTARGIYRSTDGGRSWGAANKGLKDKTIKSLVAYGNRLLAGSDHGVFQSLDRGATWTGLGLKGRSINCLAANDKALFAGVPGEGVFRTLDNGGNWTLVFPIPHVDTLSLLANGPDIFVGGDPLGLIHSQDNGTTWYHTGLESLTQNVRSLAMDDSLLYAGSYGGGICFSKDKGKSWHRNFWVTKVNCMLRYRDPHHPSDMFYLVAEASSGALMLSQNLLTISVKESDHRNEASETPEEKDTVSTEEEHYVSPRPTSMADVKKYREDTEGEKNRERAEAYRDQKKREAEDKANVEQTKRDHAAACRSDPHNVGCFQ